MPWIPGRDLLRYDDKGEILKQWQNDPCGSSAAATLIEGSKEFFERIEQNRYEEYAPWMPGAMEFDQFSGQQLLEIGFGMGSDLFQFAKHGAKVSGIDLTPRHVEITKKRFEIYGLKADLHLGDAEQLPFTDETFDVVYTFGVIHHTPGTEKVLAEIHRVLKKGGLAIVGVYHRNSAFYWFHTVLTSYIFHRRFLKEPFRRTMARIEQHGSDLDACPLVKVYSKRGLRKMLGAFSQVDLAIHHLDPAQFGMLARFVSPALSRRLESRLGWYVIAKCSK